MLVACLFVPVPGWPAKEAPASEALRLGPALQRSVPFKLDLGWRPDREPTTGGEVSAGPAVFSHLADLLLPESPRSPAATAGAVTSAEDPFADSPRPNIRRKLIGQCNWTCAGLSIGLGVAGIAALAGLEADDAEQIGDVTQLLPAVGGFTMTLLAKDWQGLKQFGFAGGTTFVVTHGLKNAADKARPNEGDNKSFPSGHTGAAFFGAGFIHERYGLKWGLPSYMMT